MKREKFLRTILASGVIAAISSSLKAAISNGNGIDKGICVESGKDRYGKQLSMFGGDTFYCKVSANDTNNSMYIFESSRVAEGGPIMHYHFEQDEWWYVLEGEFLIKVGETTFQAKKGDSVFGPRMVPHAFAKVGSEIGRLIIVFQPAGRMEEYFNKISAGVAENMTDEQRDQMRREHGFEKVGPPLTYLKQ